MSDDVRNGIILQNGDAKWSPIIPDEALRCPGTGARECWEQDDEVAIANI